MHVKDSSSLYTANVGRKLGTEFWVLPARRAESCGGRGTGTANAVYPLALSRSPPDPGAGAACFCVAHLVPRSRPLLVSCIPCPILSFSDLKRKLFQRISRVVAGKILWCIKLRLRSCFYQRALLSTRPKPSATLPPDNEGRGLSVIGLLVHGGRRRSPCFTTESQRLNNQGVFFLNSPDSSPTP